MDIKKGDYVTRNSYDNDTVFKVINIKGNVCYLKGVDVRLYADSKVEDLVIVDDYHESEEVLVDSVLSRNDRDDFFYLPGKILHIDGDDDYLKRCLKYYRDAGVYAIGKKVNENNISECIVNLLKEYKPDIVIITGHDAFYKKRNDVNNIKNYKNSENFVKAILRARTYESSHEKLVIIAGACQSNYEALIKAGANYASSPKRINIHALDPAIIATNISLTERNRLIDLPALLDKTKYGKDGIGGIIGNGLMYVGYPRQ